MKNPFSTDPLWRPGDMVRVKHCGGVYRLPEGLMVGSVCEVVSREPGYLKVRFGGKDFTVALACVERP